MPRIFGFAFALLIALAPVAGARADTPLPDQVVQGIADDLGKAIEGHQAELRADRDRLIEMIDGILLPHFDIDYASSLVLGQHASPLRLAAIGMVVIASIGVTAGARRRRGAGPDEEPPSPLTGAIPVIPD